MSVAKFTLRQFGAVFLFCGAMTLAGSAQTFTTLANFNAFPQPNSPMTLIQGFDGNFYGITGSGVGSGQCQSYCGTVFRMTPAGKLATLHSFCLQANCPDGQTPSALVQGTDGNLYGTTRGGGGGCPGGSVPGCGTIFRINTTGKFTTLYSFCLQTNCPDGSGASALIQAPNGLLYGTTYGGGANGYGTVFQVTTAGKLTTLHSFKNTDGAFPGYGIFVGSDGNIYGTTFYGGDVNCTFSSFPAGCGVVFRMAPSGSLKAIYTFCVSGFCSDGANPTGLVEGADGNFYGTTYNGGGSSSENGCQSTEDCGSIFQLTPAGKLTTIFDFCNLSDDSCLKGANPNAAMVLGTDGNLYGTTSGGGTIFSDFCYDACGTVFEVTPSGSLTSLHSFGWTDGALPATLLQSTNGTFYGTTGSGGSGLNGTIYSLSTGLALFVTADPRAAKVGAKVIINGTNLTGTTAVAFNGTKAQFSLITKTVVIAKVPAGATNGFITVTTPSGTLKSNVIFEVIP